MALIKCRECGEPVSTTAAACPKCGAPPKKQKSGGGFFGTIFVVIVLVVGYNQIKANSSITDLTNAPPAPAPSCKTDWHLCADNSDLVNNNNSMTSAQVACKTKANDSAKFGSPEWPWFAFGSFYQGSDGPQTGKIRLVEKEAKFQNGFGAMAHVIVNCTYDLTAKTVVDVSVDQP